MGLITNGGIRKLIVQVKKVFGSIIIAHSNKVLCSQTNSGRVLII